MKISLNTYEIGDLLAAHLSEKGYRFAVDDDGVPAFSWYDDQDTELAAVRAEIEVLEADDDE